MRNIIRSPHNKGPTLLDLTGSNGHDPRQVMPIKYTTSRNLFLSARANIWSPHEIGMSEDKSDWEGDKLTQSERIMVERNISYLTASDNFVPDFIAMLLGHVGAVEVRQYLRWQEAEEATHVESYLYILESFGLDLDSQNDIFKLYQQIPEIADKLDWNINLTHQLNNPGGHLTTNILLALVGAHIFEYLFFPAGFAQIFALARRGILRNTAQQYSYIWRDEILHAAHSGWMVKQLISEEPGIFTQAVKTTIQDMIEESVALEKAHAAVTIPENGVRGMTVQDYTDYIHYLANAISRRFGVTELYKKKPHPLPWLENYTLRQEVNFFEGRVRDYQATKLTF